MMCVLYLTEIPSVSRWSMGLPTAASDIKMGGELVENGYMDSMAEYLCVQSRESSLIFSLERGLRIALQERQEKKEIGRAHV